jgi:DNA repair exonuclease SbcCD ATPase subunit
VIEFAILFGLGFLSAALVAALIAPAIHRRIVAYTEKRLRATMPISPQEVRAQKDMARALYAAENARTRQELENERAKSVQISVRSNSLADDASKILTENRELRQHLDEMSVETGDLRSRLRKQEDAAEKLKAKLRHTEESNQLKVAELADLTKRASRITSELDELRINLSARELEVEQARQRNDSWRKEKDTITRDLNSSTDKSRDMANQITRDSRKIHRLEEQLAQEAARNADNENLIERRNQEIARLKERLATSSPQSGEMLIRLPNPAVANKTVTSPISEVPAVTAKPPIIDIAGSATPSVATADDKANLDSEIEEIRNQGTALTERLINIKNTNNDGAIRQEIATIAARMIALTARLEGDSSPIPDILARDTVNPDATRQSLAQRANELLAQKPN